MKKLLNTLFKVLELLAAILFMVIFVVIIAEIICRTFLGFSLLWSTDFCVLTVCWMLAFGISAAFYKRDHLRIDFIKQKLPVKVMQAVDVAVQALTLAFFLMLIPMGWSTAMTKMNILFTSLRWPMGYSYLALPVLAFFASVFSCYHLARSIRRLAGAPVEEIVDEVL